MSSRMSQGPLLFLSLCLSSIAWSGPVQAQEGGVQGKTMVDFIERGQYFASQGRLDLAIAEFESALEAGAGSAMVLNQLGDWYLMSEQPDRALAMFRRSLDEKPGQLPVYARLREAFLVKGQLDSALTVVHQARELAPEESAVYSSLGFLYLQTGQNGLAKTYLDTAFQLDPANPDAHRFLGMYYTGLDSLDQALEHFTKMIDMVPDDPGPHNNIAYIYAVREDFPKALEAYRVAEKLAQDPAMRHNIHLSMEEVRAVMDGKMRARYILVETRSEAQALLQRIESGEDFGALAQQYSKDPNAQVGGDVGFFSPGELVPEFEDAVQVLEVGSNSAVVEGPAGFMIIQRLN